MSTSPSTTMPAKATSRIIVSHDVHLAPGPVRVLDILPRPQVVLPGPRVLEHQWCSARAERFRCSRRAGHQGRHAHVWWWAGGVVRAVWGQAPARADLVQKLRPLPIPKDEVAA